MFLSDILRCETSKKNFQFRDGALFTKIRVSQTKAFDKVTKC